jgi:hypothetical protein
MEGSTRLNAAGACADADVGGWSWKAARGGVVRHLDKRQMDVMWNAALAAIGAATVSAASMAFLELSSGNLLA